VNNIRTGEGEEITSKEEQPSTEDGTEKPIGGVWIIDDELLVLEWVAESFIF
jgi:hypothetical protein